MAPKKPNNPSDTSAPKQTPFYWTSELSKTLVELLLAYQQSVGREQPIAWKKLKDEFEASTGKKVNFHTLKNHNRDMKADWSKWKALKHGETGLGWDATKGTIAATDEWWAKKLKGHPEFSRFRKKGVPPELEELWTQLYDGAVATGEYCIAPSMAASEGRHGEERHDNHSGYADENDYSCDDEDGDERDCGSQVDPLLRGGDYIEELDDLFPQPSVHVTPTPEGAGVGDNTCERATPTAPPVRASGSTPGHLNRGKRPVGPDSTSTQVPGKRS